MTTEARTTHTPGPWKFLQWGQQIDVSDAAHEYGTVALVGAYEDRDKGIPTRENVANARLIAAAPEMYEALRDIASHPDTSKVATRWARAALAKAEGRE